MFPFLLWCLCLLRYLLHHPPSHQFYTPYHLCHVEVPISCARAVLFNDVVCAAAGAPVADVLAVAKTDLEVRCDHRNSIGGDCLLVDCCFLCSIPCLSVGRGCMSQQQCGSTH